jgi:hypothetical protein
MQDKGGTATNYIQVAKPLEQCTISIKYIPVLVSYLTQTIVISIFIKGLFSIQPKFFLFSCCRSLSRAKKNSKGFATPNKKIFTAADLQSGSVNIFLFALDYFFLPLICCYQQENKHFYIKRI